MISGATQVFALLGHPVRHSLSPALHTRLFRQLGIDAIYVAFDVDPVRAGALGEAIRTLDLRGANLTVPFKTAILPQLDRLTRAGEEAGAVNVVIQQEGELVGYNTDGEGFVRGVEAAFGAQLLPGSEAIVLGAGGAARAVAAGMADRGVAQVCLLNRTVVRAQQAAEHLQHYFPHTRFLFDTLDPSSFAHYAPSAGLVASCTAGGAEALLATLDVNLLPARAVWCDINYWLQAPAALNRCRARGLQVQDGLPMLLHQGALSFELFTGVTVDPDAISFHVE